MGSRFDESYVQAFSSFKKLKKVYLYKTNSKAKGLETLNNGTLIIDYGNYELPIIPSDSITY